MKKYLLSLLFVMAVLCSGVSAVSAKNSSSSANSVAMSKRLLAASAKANSLKTRCKSGDCAAELFILIWSNEIYESYCAPNYTTGCSEFWENQVIAAGTQYEACAGYLSKNVDRGMDRNKIYKPRNVMSR